MKKWILIAVAILVVGLAGFQWYSAKASTKTADAQVRTATVQKGTLDVKISGSGTIQAVTSEDITSNLNNDEIDEVLVTVGEQVKEGDELMTFIDGSDPIIAPADGKITVLSVAAGDPVTTGQVVAHVTSYQGLQTVVQIDELDITKIKVGQAVDINVNAFPDQQYTGKVTKVSNEGTSSSGVSTFDVTIEITKTDNLKVGMSAEASILIESKKDAIYVPLDAVHSENNKKYVAVVGADLDNQGTETEQKTVKTGLANEDYVEITEGLSEGEKVQLPKLATGSSSSTQGTQNSGFGTISGMGGMNRLGGNSGQFSGKGGY